MSEIFGEEFVKDPALSKFKDPKSFAQSYKELQSQLGKPKFDVPAADAPPEQVAEFYKKLGVPDKPEDYGLKPDANVKEHDNEVNQVFLKAFATTAHDLKMTPSQVTGMQKFFDDLSVNMVKQQEKAMAESDAQLEEMLKTALGDKFDSTVADMTKLIQEIMPEDMRVKMEGKVTNEALVAMGMLDKHYKSKMAEMEEHYKKTYGVSDKNIGDTGDTSSRTLADLQTEGKKIYEEMTKKGLMHPEYKTLKATYDGIYKQIASMNAAAR